MTRLVSECKMIETDDYSVHLKTYNFLFKHEKDPYEFSYIIDLNIYKCKYIIRHYISYLHAKVNIKLVNKETNVKSNKSLNCHDDYYIFHLKLELKKEKNYQNEIILEKLKNCFNNFIIDLDYLSKIDTKKPLEEDFLEIFPEPKVQNNTLYYTYHPDDEFDESEIELDKKHENYHENRHSTYVHFQLNNDILHYKTIFQTFHIITHHIHIPGTDKIEGSKKLNKKQMEMIKQSNPNKIKTFFKTIFWKEINKNLPNPFRDPKKQYITHYSKWIKGSQEEFDSLIKAVFITSSANLLKKADIDRIKINILSDIPNNKDSKNIIMEFKINHNEEKNKEKDRFIKNIQKMIFEDFHFVGWRTNYDNCYDKRREKIYNKYRIEINYDIQNIKPHEFIDSHIKLKNYIEKKYPEKDPIKTINKLKTLFEKIL